MPLYLCVHYAYIMLERLEPQCSAALKGMYLGKQLAWGVAGEEGALQRQLSQDASQGPRVHSCAICQSSTCQHLQTSNALHTSCVILQVLGSTLPCIIINNMIIDTCSMRAGSLVSQLQAACSIACQHLSQAVLRQILQYRHTCAA